MHHTQYIILTLILTILWTYVNYKTYHHDFGFSFSPLGLLRSLDEQFGRRILWGKGREGFSSDFSTLLHLCMAQWNYDMKWCQMTYVAELFNGLDKATITHWSRRKQIPTWSSKIKWYKNEKKIHQFLKNWILMFTLNNKCVINVAEAIIKVG